MNNKNNNQPMYNNKSNNIIYAGFQIRFIALIIDFIILFLIGFAIGVIVGILGIFDLWESVSKVVSFVIVVTYFALMESSQKQATIGKSAMGLKVTDLNMNRITPLKAVLRYGAKIISGLIILIGYIMAGFTQKKQALHDILVGTLVIKSN